MRLLKRLRKDRDREATGIFEDLDFVMRGLRKLPFLLPVVVLLGVGAGKFANGFLGHDVQNYALAGVLAPIGQLEALGRKMHDLQGAGAETADYVAVYQEHVFPVEHVLRRRGVPAETARNMAWPLVEHSYENKLDLATVLSVIFIESNAKPKATSSVGARGLMQVMPWWSGRWRGCGLDLYEIEDNLCNGTRILAYYLSRYNGNTRRAFLGYNGCVTGSNTPNCHTYPDKIETMRRQFAAELASARSGPSVGRAAAP